tara:strand:- start:442 stop:588 length:147 start_codon:yes stop_codon:yes gene_type:complete
LGNREELIPVAIVAGGEYMVEEHTVTRRKEGQINICQLGNYPKKSDKD